MTSPTTFASADQIASLIGYLLMGGLFVFAGFDHFTRFAAVKRLLVDRSWRFPGLLLAAASVLEIAAGLGLAIGVMRPWAALALTGFTVVASLTLLDFWRFEGPQREGMRSGFLVNVALVGGLVLAFGTSR